MKGLQKSQEAIFHNDIINQMIENCWLLEPSDGYNRKLALYEDNVLGFVQKTQNKQWQKYCKLYPQHPEKYLLEKVADQLNKAGQNPSQFSLQMLILPKLDIRRCEYENCLH